MGIYGLGKFLKWKVPQARHSIRLEQWCPGPNSQRQCGIDISCILYRARGAGLSPLTVVASLIVRLRQARVTPIVVFDGKPPAAKAEVVEQRRTVRVAAHREITELRALPEPTTEKERGERENRVVELQKKAPVVTGGERDEIKQFLYSCGVRFVTANGEADDLLAFLARAGQLSAVITTDMDFLARGVPNVIVPETPDCSVLTLISLDAVLRALGLTQRQFVEACQLMGSDYSPVGFQRMEPRAALSAASAGVNWAAMDCSGELLRGVSLLAGDGVKWGDLVSEKQTQKWLLPLPPVEPAVIGMLAQREEWPTPWPAWLLSA